MNKKTKKQLIKELTESRERQKTYDAIMQVNIDGFCLTSFGGEILDVNNAFCRLTGYSHDELIGINVAKLTRKGSFEKFSKIIKKMKKQGPQHFESYLKRKNGEILNIDFGVNFLKRCEEENIFVFARDITQKISMEKKIVEQKQSLEEKNTALKEILSQIEMEKEQIKKNIIDNIDRLIIPALKKLTIHATPLQRKKIVLIEKNLNNLSSSFTNKIITQKLKLSPKEIEVCGMIKNGLSSKEISEILCSSLRTVEAHRQHIRKKFDLQNNKINLTSYLQNISN